MNSGTEPLILPGCSVLPPMDLGNGGPESRRHQGADGKVGQRKNGQAGRKKTGNCFGVLNSFVDFTMGLLTRSELIVWFLLYRDTKDGTARTSHADLARRGRLGESDQDT